MAAEQLRSPRPRDTRTIAATARSYFAGDGGSFARLGVQEPFGAEELTGDELVSGLQLQWASHTEFPNVVRIFELNCCAIPLTAVAGGGVR